MNHNYRAAFTQTDITPDFPVEMIGCYRTDNKPNGSLYPLLAQVLLLEHQRKHYCLIAVDSLGLTVDLSSQLRTLVAKALGSDPENVMLNFSHTHSAPAPLSPLNGEKYFKFMCDKILTCVKDALTSIQPCLVAWAMSEVEMAENRREGCSAIDTRLGALKVFTAARKPIVTLLRVCAHANILMTHSNKLSSDYFGAAREKISACFGCPTMMIQGAAGNIKPIGVDKVNGGSIVDVDRISDIILKAAVKLQFTPKEVTRLIMLEKEMKMYSDVPQPDEARQIAEKAEMDATNWLNECARLRNTGITTQTQNSSIHFLLLNEGCLCGVPDEIFCEISLAAVEQTRYPLLFFNGYTNGCTGYLPHKEEWVKGGYETHDSYLVYYNFHGHVMPYQADTAERLVKNVVEVWNNFK